MTLTKRGFEKIYLYEYLMSRFIENVDIQISDLR